MFSVARLRFVTGCAVACGLLACGSGVEDEGGAPLLVAGGTAGAATGGHGAQAGTSSAGNGAAGQAGQATAGQSGGGHASAGSSGAPSGGAAGGGNAGSGNAGSAGTTGGKAGSTGGQAGSQSGGAGGTGNAGGSGGAGAGGAAGGSGGAGAGGSGGASCVGIPGSPLLTYNLASAPFPSSSHPSVAVHVPAGFKPCERPGLVVFFHGFNNCVANVLGSVDGECTPGDGARSALSLSEQLDASKANAILVAVQLSFDQATGAPGALAKAGGLRALLDELFDQHLAMPLGAPIGVDDLDRVVLASHSGGYWATAVSLSSGNVPRVTEVQLYDSLYGEEALFRAWVDGHLAQFDVARSDVLRFNTVYTVGGGTLDNAQAMAAWVAPKLAAKGLAPSLLDDPTTATLDEPAFDHPLIFKRSALSHNDVPRYYFERMVRHAGFLSLP